MDIDELRQLGLEQLNLTLKDTAENLFRLKLQSQSERLNAPSELKRNRRLIARIRTLIRERELAAKAAGNVPAIK
jgi:large subunit ribosomal protein L29